MLAMSAMDDSLSGDNKKLQVVTDINDNMQPLNGQYHFQDKMQRKIDMDSFPNFDMWSSNLVPTLPNSPTNSDSPMAYESLDKLPNKSSRDWENSAKCLQSSLFNGYQYTNDSGVSNCHLNYDLSTNKVVDQTWPIAAVRYQNYPACYVLLQPAYLYSKDVAACPQPSVIARHTRDDYDCRLYGRNEQIGIHGSTATDPSAIQIGEKFDDYEFWRSGITRKAGNKQESDAISRPTNLATSCYVQNYAPNLVLNLTPICTSAENATSCFVPHANGNDEKRLRPILKQEIVHAQL